MGNNSTARARFLTKIRKDPSGCWIWTAASRDGRYGALTLWVDGKWKLVNAHRVAWILFRGPIPEGLCVLHKCDVERCANPKHLFLGTNPENTEDRTRKGRSAKGERNGSSILSNFQIRRLRRLYASGQYLQRELGEMFGLSRVGVSRIIRNVYRKEAA